MHSNNDWNRSKEIGDKYEAMLPDYIDDYDEYVKAPNKQFSDWDAKFRKGDTWTYYECKADLSAYRTKNLFIEYRHSNNPSGISLTKSDYYMFFIVDVTKDELIEVLKIETDAIREKCNSGRYRTATCWNSGWNRSEGYIIPISDFDISPV